DEGAAGEGVCVSLEKGTKEEGSGEVDDDIGREDQVLRVGEGADGGDRLGGRRLAVQATDELERGIVRGETAHGLAHSSPRAAHEQPNRIRQRQTPTSAAIPTARMRSRRMASV